MACLFDCCRRHLAVICFVMLPLYTGICYLTTLSSRLIMLGRLRIRLCNVPVCENDLIIRSDDVLLTGLHSVIPFLNTLASRKCATVHARKHVRKSVSNNTVYYSLCYCVQVRSMMTVHWSVLQMLWHFGLVLTKILWVNSCFECPFLELNA